MHCLLLALCATSALAYLPACQTARPALRPAPLARNRRHVAPRADEGSLGLPTGLPALPDATQLPPVEAAVVTDTLLDLAVYGLIAGVAALTIYSLVVTLQKSNEEYGGWSPRDDEDVKAASADPSQRLRAGARYDPVTETWTYPEQPKQGAKVGRAPVAGGAVDADGNRYDRRMRKKEKKAEKARKNKGK